MDDGALLPRRVTEEATPSLHKLPGIGGTGEQKAHTEVGDIDALVEAADGDDPIEEAAGEVPENLLPLLGAFAEGEVPDLEAMLFPQQAGHRLDLANFLVSDDIGRPAVTAVEEGFLRALRESGDHLIEDIELVLRARQQPGAPDQQAHGGLANLVVLFLPPHHPAELGGDLRVFFGLILRERDDVRVITIGAKPSVRDGTGQGELVNNTAEVIDNGLRAHGIVVALRGGGEAEA